MTEELRAVLHLAIEIILAIHELARIIGRKRMVEIFFGPAPTHRGSVRAAR